MGRWWSLLLSGQGAQLRPGRASRSQERGAPAAPTPLDGVLSERRAEVMRALFPMVADWRASQSHFQRQALAYEELSRAADLADLARRERRLRLAGLHAVREPACG